MLSGLLTLNAQSISPHAGNKSICYVMRRKHATGNKETVSIAGRDPTRGPRVHYCYSTALQNVVSMWKIVYFRVKYTDHAHTGTQSIIQPIPASMHWGDQETKSAISYARKTVKWLALSRYEGEHSGILKSASVCLSPHTRSWREATRTA